MDLNVRPPWSNRALRRLGEALRNGTTAPIDGPSYANVLLWHADLADEVQNQIESGHWAVASQLLATSASRISTELLVSSRPKTQDTLVEKLRRQPALQLSAVQDIAGVRVDADLLLNEQTELAHEIAEHFGADESAVHDLRDGTHAGYRAVHVWLRLPAGRVEIQIRTTVQSLWANAYERLGDVCGRGIRYGEPIGQAHHPGVDPAQVGEAVRTMQALSASLAATEYKWQELAELGTSSQQMMDARTDAAAKAMTIAAAVLTIKRSEPGKEGG